MAKLIVINLRPYSMLNYTLPRIQNGFQICAVPSRSGDMRLQSQKLLKNGVLARSFPFFKRTRLPRLSFFSVLGYYA